MGLFSNMSDIGQINALLKQIDPKISAILYETESPYPNINRLKVESGSISVLMSEVMDIACKTPNSVKLAPYYLMGRKMRLPEISAFLAEIVERCERM